MTETEVIIVGAGPIGLELAAAFQELEVPYLQFDAKQLGHTISWFPRHAQFFSSPERIAICGVPLQTVHQTKATREEYLTYLIGVVQQFALPIRTYERVTHVVPVQPDDTSSTSRFEIRTESAHGARSYRCRYLVLAIGDMHRPRVLSLPGGAPVPGAERAHVHSYFVEPHPYVGQHLLIVGGRNSAVEAAIRCYRAGARVAVSYRRGEIDSSVKYWLRPEIEWLIKHHAIEFFPCTLPMEISATHVRLARTSDAKSMDESSVQTVPADFVLPLIGFEMEPTLMEMAGVRLIGENRRPQVNLETMQTNVPGLFVAGTAAAGTQIRYRLFIENGHSHVLRIVRTVAGRDPGRINPLAFSRLHEQPFAEEQ